jgi:hypothetical protein
MNKHQTRKEADKQIKKLIEASSPEDCRAIRRGRKAGRELRNLAERFWYTGGLDMNIRLDLISVNEGAQQRPFDENIISRYMAQKDAQAPGRLS